MFRLVRILHQDDPTCFLDCFHANTAIGPGTGENNRKGIFLLRRQGPEQQIDWGSLTARLLELERRKLLIGDLKASVWWNDIDVVGFERHGALDLRDGHPGI